MNFNGFDDYMEVGSLVPLADGWYFDTDTNTRFKLDEDGTPVDEFGTPVFETDNDDEF